MLRDDLGTGAEASTGVEARRHRSYKHVDFGGLGKQVVRIVDYYKRSQNSTHRHARELRETATGGAEGTERERLIKDEPTFVFVLELDELLKIADHAVVLKEALRDDEPTGKLAALALGLVGDRLEDLLERAHVAVLVPTNLGPRDLKTLLDRKVAEPVGDDDIAALGERGDD